MASRSLRPTEESGNTEKERGKREREREREREKSKRERGTVPNDAVKSNSRAIINCGQI